MVSSPWKGLDDFNIVNPLELLRIPAVQEYLVVRANKLHFVFKRFA